jgi:hypothetical protein
LDQPLLDIRTSVLYNPFYPDEAKMIQPSSIVPLALSSSLRVALTCTLPALHSFGAGSAFPAVRDRAWKVFVLADAKCTPWREDVKRSPLRGAGIRSSQKLIFFYSKLHGTA